MVALRRICLPVRVRGLTFPEPSRSLPGVFLQVQLAYPVELPDEEDELAWEAAQRGPRGEGPRGEVREERPERRGRT